VPHIQSGATRKQRAARIQVEGRIEVLLGNLAQWDGFVRASARVQDVDLALFPLDCGIYPFSPKLT
jgi:hypothetical protein